MTMATRIRTDKERKVRGVFMSTNIAATNAKREEKEEFIEARRVLITMDA